MKYLLRLALLAFALTFMVSGLTACSSDGLTSTGTTVYVSHGYGGYGPGWGYGWGGYVGGGGYWGPGW
jgi:hypothetical protein